MTLKHLDVPHHGNHNPQSINEPRLSRLTLRRLGLNVAASMSRLGLSILHYPKHPPTWIGWLLSQSKILLTSYQRLTVLFCHNTSSLLQCMRRFLH